MTVFVTVTTTCEAASPIRASEETSVEVENSMTQMCFVKGVSLKLSRSRLMQQCWWFGAGKLVRMSLGEVQKFIYKEDSFRSPPSYPCLEVFVYC